MIRTADSTFPLQHQANALMCAVCCVPQNAGAVIRTADSTNFPGATSMASTLVKFAPYGLRQLHWHPLEDEWQYR